MVKIMPIAKQPMLIVESPMYLYVFVECDASLIRYIYFISSILTSSRRMWREREREINVNV